MVSKASGSGKALVDLLCRVYISGLREGDARVGKIAREIGGSPTEFKALLKKAAKAKLVRSVGNRVVLTRAGRKKLKVVMMGGAFEIIHPGHVHALSEAKGLGNILVVVVATDESVKRNKERPPATDQASRVALVSSLRQVDLALPGNKGSIFEILSKVRPDIVALGYDQHHNAEEIVREAGKRGITIRAARLGSPIPNVKTSKILLSM